MKSRFSLGRFAWLASTTVALIAFLILAWSQSVKAAEQKILFVNVYPHDGYYLSDAANIFTTITNAGAVATYVDIVSGG